MGQRTVKRVPLDFSWPKNEVWEGYINPHYKQCPDCNNGYTTARERLETLARLIMLSGSDSREGKNHPYFTEDSALNDGVRPSKDMSELTVGLAGRDLGSPFGHDAMDTWSATKKIITAAGLDPEKWGICNTCDGRANDPATREAYEAWNDYEPPEGEGWQLWETTSEGSPVSPVFDSAENLAEWCADNATLFAREKAPKDYWLKMFLEDTTEAGSMMVMEVNANPT